MNVEIMQWDLRLLCLILMGDQIYVISSIFLETVIAIKIETIRQEMVSWLNIFENREFYGLGDIVDEKKLRKFVMARSVSMLMSLFGIIIMEAYLLSRHAYDNLSWSHSRHISTTIASIIETFIFVEALHKIFIMGAVLNPCRRLYARPI
jgi:hypothetical protein